MNKQTLLSLVGKDSTGPILSPSAPLLEGDEKSQQELLKHFVQESVHVLQGLDNLGNFLMGFGMVMLGYLLNAKLRMHFVNIFAKAKGYLALSSWVCLFAWCAAVVLLLGVIYLFVFHMLAGRAVHASNNQKGSIGKRIKRKHLSYEEFAQQAPDFGSFVDKNYLKEDQTNARQLWYATFRYTRYMAFRKLMIMNKMRSLLAWAILCGVLFKVTEIWLKVFV